MLRGNISDIPKFGNILKSFDKNYKFSPSLQTTFYSYPYTFKTKERQKTTNLPVATNAEL